MPIETIAERLFASTCADGELVELLVDHGVNVEDYSHDWYDESLEVFGHSDEPISDALRDDLRRCGFSLVWMHKAECKPPRGDGCRCACQPLKREAVKQ